MATQYEAALAFRGDLGKAFDLAETALTALGFRLTERTAASLELTGPGMNSTNQSALVGASRIHIFKEDDKLAILADLGGVARMSRFVTVFPLALVLSIGAVLSVIFTLRFGPGGWLTAVLGVVSVNGAMWLVLGPHMAHGMRTRTIRALDTLLANMVAVGETDPH